MALHLIRQLKQMDEQRPSFPGEHWLVMATGVAMLLRARKNQGTLARVVAIASAGALLYRAASGRDGLLTRLRR